MSFPNSRAAAPPPPRGPSPPNHGEHHAGDAERAAAIDRARRVNAAIAGRRRTRRRADAEARYVADLHARAAALDCPAAAALMRRRREREADRNTARAAAAAGVAAPTIAAALDRPLEIITRWVANTDATPATAAGDVAGDTPRAAITAAPVSVMVSQPEIRSAPPAEADDALGGLMTATPLTQSTNRYPNALDGAPTPTPATQAQSTCQAAPRRTPRTLA